MSEGKRAKQLAFNGVWRGLKWQGFEPSYHEEEEVCMYRHPDGKRRCAAGWLIRDEDYQRSFERRSVYQGETSFFVDDALGKTFAQFGERAPLSFISRAQFLHDEVGETCFGNVRLRLEEAMRRLANEHGLTIPDGD